MISPLRRAVEVEYEGHAGRGRRGVRVLGRLPFVEVSVYAREEAKWGDHVLKTTASSNLDRLLLESREC